MTLECRIKEKYDKSETGYYLVAEIVIILVDEKYLAEDGIRDTILSRGLGDVYKRQANTASNPCLR